MGEVYLAEDTNLKRKVAIKVLPQEFAVDKEREARFEREARLLASLNHPNIATIHGLEKSEGQQFLVMELVEGDTLADRIKKGPLPLDEALEICKQIAEGLESAHEKGIIHRDLKPSNVKVTPEGKVKILDFGLARAFQEEPEMADLSKSPTLTDQMTRPGVILGTAAYMSPEHTRSRPVNKRTDIWAFGCVLYECLTGKPVFQGDTVSDILALILRGEPDWAKLPANTPATIRTLLRRCLRKDPRNRLHDISDARIEIEDLMDRTLPLEPSTSSTRQRILWRQVTLGSSIALAIIVTGISVWIFKPSGHLRAPSSTYLDIILPRNQFLVAGYASSAAISPDGRNLVYVGGTSDQTLPPQLYLRSLDSYTTKFITGTNGASAPFFSPNGKWLGFYAHGKLWKVPITGGIPIMICDSARLSTGASWGSNDTIIFTVFGSGLLRVSANGGQPEELTTPDIEKGELGHQWPQILEEDKGILFSIVTSDGHGRIAIFSPATGEQHELFRGSHAARYLPPGYLVYTFAGGLWAVPFDLEKMILSGSPVQMLDGISRQFTISENGTLVYVTNPPSDNTLAWVDRKGNATQILEVPGCYQAPRLSPDGRQLAYQWAGDIWVLEFERAVGTRLITDGVNSVPIWTPDGSRIMFASSRSRSVDIYWNKTTGSNEEEAPLLTKDPYPQVPSSWSTDGQHLLFTEVHPETIGDIWVLSRAGDLSTYPVIATEANERMAAFSPDGNWFAYVSDETGRDEVYVQSFPGLDRRFRISTDGGSFPVWRADGTELFYLQQDGWITSVAVEIDPVLVAKRPQRLFKGQFMGIFDVRADGQQFVMVQNIEESAASITQLHIILSLFEELSRLVPSEK